MPTCLFVPDVCEVMMREVQIDVGEFEDFG
jgi:hypothetical protein